MSQLNSTHHDHSYSQITEYLYLGYNMRCCESHFQQLLSLGIRVDVNVEAENEECSSDMEVHIWLPTKEHGVPSQSQLLIGANAISGAVKMKKKIYVHCEKGHVRSAVLVAAYLITEGYNAEEAVDFVKQKRSVIHPGEKHLQALREFASMVNNLVPNPYRGFKISV